MMERRRIGDWTVARALGRQRLGFRVPVFAVLCAIMPLGARLAAAQQPGWHGVIEASGNVLFGAARGRLGSFAAGASRADSAAELRADALLTYADTRSDDGVRTVTARSSRLSVAFDLTPQARVSHFTFASAEASLQQRIALRYGGGVGTKLTYWRRGKDDLSSSLALLWERTRALDVDTLVPTTERRFRWSLRLRARRQLTPNLRVSHVTFYQPTVDHVSQFTTDSNTQAAVSLNSHLNLTATLRHKFDTEARRRGARSNHDGQFLFGLSATF